MILLRLTCTACPEQYDAFIDDVQVGYLRLRHGEFTVSAPDYGGERVYEAYPNGDGEFDDDERDFHLGRAAAALIRWYAPRAITQHWPDGEPPEVAYEIEIRR